MIGRSQAAWKNPQILFTLLLVFCCGALAGAVIYKLTSQPVSAKQVAAGWKCSLSLGIYGTRGSARWDFQQPNEILIGRRDGARSVLSIG